MSNPALATQAAHTLTLLKDLDHDGYKKLHDGHLSDLALAIKSGVIGKREDSRRGLGLYKALQLCNDFPLVLDMVEKPWEHWRGVATREYYESFKESPSGRNETCRAYLYHFLVDIPFDEVRRSICEARGAMGWLFGKHEHLLTLAVQMPYNERVTDMSVRSLTWSDDDKECGGVLTMDVDNRFRGGKKVWQDTILPADAYVLVIS